VPSSVNGSRLSPIDDSLTTGFSKSRRMIHRALVLWDHQKPLLILMDLDRERFLRPQSFKLCGVTTLNLQIPAANDSVLQQLIPFK
jgi:hypothetical protein